MVIEFPWVLLLARVVLAMVMIYYGWPKVHDLRANAEDFAQMGFQPAFLWGTVVAVVEFIGGIAVLLGLYAELAAALFAFQMMVGTLWKLKIRKPFSDYSYDIQLFALCLVILSQGAGALALTAFPGAVFLRWDAALGALVLAGILAWSCKPALRQEEGMSRAA